MLGLERMNHSTRVKYDSTPSSTSASITITAQGVHRDHNPVEFIVYVLGDGLVPHVTLLVMDFESQIQ